VRNLGGVGEFPAPKTFCRMKGRPWDISGGDRGKTHRKGREKKRVPVGIGGVLVQSKNQGKTGPLNKHHSLKGRGVRKGGIYKGRRKS